ncbi:3-oxo-tetronate 4-phosphate decarboxylase [Stutzerimonas azotifigens]|uniref:3-oxo-tetronate 4-phosphate decarboxylase n=1 Tax=Stutzerimonas azotifigens TaxID=291995 RepID=A0ABR5YYD3_9GAMM|nr:3-oxo-tetronate 4-phosphate decarboxylase [Stutzerimonas azotifigens]MBA1272955.1 aldolase [Stutzerimonas azotifigens]
MSEESALREEIVEIGRSLYLRGLSPGSSGNISARLDDGWLLTPTNACLGRLDPGDIAKLDWQGNHLAGKPASKEAFLHRAVYEGREDSGAIVHLHCTHSAAVSCLDCLDATSCLPPLTPYFVMRVGRLPLIPYHRPGDPQLGEAIRGLVGQHSSVLLANHGPVVSGKSLEAATYAIEELEETAKLYLLLRQQPVRPLDDDQIEELRQTFGAQW